mgnify:CR=1 FL=1
MLLHQYKIVFGGAMGAGKSSAIQCLSDIPVFSTEVLNTDLNAHQKELTTVGIDYGEISLDEDTKIGLYGTPGQERFDFMWPLLCKGAIGSIVLIDHSSHSAVMALEFYVNKFKSYTDNIVIGVTHVDENAAISADVYQQWLFKNKLQLPLFFVDARDKKDILLMVETLVSVLEVKTDLN